MSRIAYVITRAQTRDEVLNQILANGDAPPEAVIDHLLSGDSPVGPSVHANFMAAIMLAARLDDERDTPEGVLVIPITTQHITAHYAALTPA